MTVLRRSFFAAMGTRVEVTVPHDAERGVEALVQRLFAQREAALSRFRPGSELSRLNAAAGTTVPVGALLLASVESALAGARATDGAFDPSLNAQIRRLGYDRSFDEIAAGPGMREGGGIGPGGAWRRIVIDRDWSCVTLPGGVALDLGGIAKGMAVDASIALLRDAGVEAALVSAGGDLAVLGRPPGRAGWTIDVRTPRGGAPLTLERGAIVTSGIERRSWRQGGLERHHLLDPATGLPARSGVWSASAVAATCERAEVAATAAFVLGAGAGARFLARNGLTGLIVTPSGGCLPVGDWPAALAA